VQRKNVTTLQKTNTQRKGDYIMSYNKVKATNILNAVTGTKPAIDRTNEYTFNHMGKYYVGPSANGRFLQVNDGRHIRYYGNPFWNLYRIVSRDGSDFVIHQAK
jgi:hypothetical protein